MINYYVIFFFWCNISSTDCWCFTYTLWGLTITTHNDPMAFNWNICNSFRIACLGANCQTAHVQGRSEESGANAIHKQPSTQNWQELVDAPFTLPLDWDTFEVYPTLESSRVIQQDLTCVNNSDNLLDNTLCIDFFPFPVSFPQTPTSWNKPLT